MATNRKSVARYLRTISLSLAVTIVGVTLLPAVASAAERATKSKSAFGKYNPDDESVDLFQGVKDGQLDVKFIPKDSTQASVLITNKSKKPLNVKLPEAFAAAPILAQGFGGLGGGGGRLGGGNNVGGGGMGGGGQGMGGGMGGGGMGGGGMGGGGMGGGGMFNVPAEKVGKLKVTCVCLEHGKPEPRAAMPYRIMPLEEFTSNPAVREVCTLLGYGKINQRVAQASAWNLNNAMSWDVLAAKRIEHLGGASEPYFSAEELRSAMSLSTEAATLAEKRATEPSKKSPGEKSASEGGFDQDAKAETKSVAADKAVVRRKARTR